MATDVRYCESCWTEFVDGIQRCSDCGGPLLDGELPRVRPVTEEEEASFVAIAPDLSAIDSLAAEIPGQDAEHFAEALKIEGIVSRLECGDLVRFRGPGQKATGMISLSEPVRVFVSAADLESARDILESINQADLIGDAWAEGSEEFDVDDSGLLRAAQTDIDAPTAPPNLQPEGNHRGSIIALVLAVAVGMLFLFVFGRG